MFLSSGLDFIQFLHQFRSPSLDLFFKALNFFDRPEFFLILVSAVWLGYDWKAGIRLFYLLLVSNLANQILKDFFELPRPFHLNPSLGIIQVESYGFPSGAAQTAVLLSGLLVVYWKSHWKWITAFTYFFLISLSRLYLGVHFPSDILGGWMIGGSLLMLFLFLQPRIETYLEKLDLFNLLIISQLIPLLLLTWHSSVPAIRVCSVAMGTGIGLFITYRYDLLISLPENYTQLVMRAIIGILGTFLCYGVTSKFLGSTSDVQLFIQFFLIGIWASLGGNMLFRFIFPNSRLSIEKV